MGYVIRHSGKEPRRVLSFRECLFLNFCAVSMFSSCSLDWPGATGVLLWVYLEIQDSVRSGFIQDSS